MKTLSVATATLITLACAACHSEQTRVKVDNLVARQETGASAAPPTAEAFRIEEKDDLLDFTYAWPAEAAAMPELAARFDKAMREWKAELLKGAKADKALRVKQGDSFNGYTGSTIWTSAGQSARLLSLVGETNSYTGGAHGNHGTTALLWDREAKREIKLADLFAAATSRDMLLSQTWCAELNKAREEKRGEPVGKDGPFEDCPGLGDITVVPTDTDGDGRFERLALIADPYVAGPWAEGDYEVELPVTEPFLTALKSAYRDSFKAL